MYIHSNTASLQPTSRASQRPGIKITLLLSVILLLLFTLKKKKGRKKKRKKLLPRPPQLPSSESTSPHQEKKSLGGKKKIQRKLETNEIGKKEGRKEGRKEGKKSININAHIPQVPLRHLNLAHQLCMGLREVVKRQDSPPQARNEVSAECDERPERQLYRREVVGGVC